MTLTRRRFLGQATPLGLLPLLPACGGVEELPGESQAELSAGGEVFQHGVASGDPLADAVILWTRVTPVAGEAVPAQVEWRVARDPELRSVVVSGSSPLSADSDYTVKVDASGLAAG